MPTEPPGRRPELPDAPLAPDDAARGEGAEPSPAPSAESDVPGTIGGGQGVVSVCPEGVRLLEYCSEAWDHLSGAGRHGYGCNEDIGFPACGRWLCEAGAPIAEDAEPHLSDVSEQCGALTDVGHRETERIGERLRECVSERWAAGVRLINVGDQARLWGCVGEDGSLQRACLWPAAVAHADCGAEAIAALLRLPTGLSDSPAAFAESGTLCVETSENSHTRPPGGCPE